MEDTIIKKKNFNLSREHKSKICCESLTQRMSVSRVSLIILITIIFGFTNKTAYAQIEIDSEQKQLTEEVIDSNKKVSESEISEFFTVDNNTYKVLSQDKDDDTVMFWKCEKLNDLKSIIINNQVNYNGHNFKIKYVYEKAFFNSSTNIKNIIIDDEILGFCDLDGNPVEILRLVFKDQKQLENISFSNQNPIFGEKCFQNCSDLMDIEIPCNMNIMETSCFDKCSSLKNIDLSNITRFDGQSSFANCVKLEKIGGINDKVIELPNSTFTGCAVLRIDSLNNVTKLGNGCFEYCTVLNENIVTNVEEIGDNCFLGCNFNEIYLRKAKSVGYNAFGKIGNLKKVRFGDSNIPFLGGNIVAGSSVNEWVYPVGYINQPGYLEFLSKLRVSKVIWYHNYENMKCELTQSVKLSVLEPPSITRDGYEIEGWYKEPECLNKVKMIADLGKSVDSDVVIKEPALYAKWIEKEPPTPPKDPIEQEEAPTPGGEKDPIEPEEPPTPGGEKDPIEQEEAPTPGGEKDPIELEEPPTPGGEKDPIEPEEAPTPGEVNNSIDPEDSTTSGETKESNNLEKPTIRKAANRSRKTKSESNDFKDFIIKIEDENKHIDIKETKKLSNETIKNVFIPTVEKTDIQIKDFNWSYRDNADDNIKINKHGSISKIIKDDKCIGIYLKSNDGFMNNTIIEINIKKMIKPSKLYSYSEELGKFILINENLQINDDKIEFEPINKKEYLITKFDLNEDDVAIQGWNKVLPEQSNALLSKHINELSWVYLQGKDLSKGWIEDCKDNNCYFMNEKGIMEIGWLKDKDDKWYYLNTISDGSKGAMKIGWNNINNEWYYFENNGVLAVNTIIDGCAVGYDGKLI